MARDTDMPEGDPANWASQYDPPESSDISASGVLAGLLLIAIAGAAKNLYRFLIVVPYKFVRAIF